MDIFLGISAGVVVLAVVLVVIFEYRIRKPDVLVLYEKKGQLSIHGGPFYPRHFSLPFKRTTHPIQLNVQASSR